MKTALILLALFAAPVRAMDMACMMLAAQGACPGVQPGSDEFRACMQKHPEVMSRCMSAPAATEQEVAQKAAPPAHPCAADAEKFCPGKFPGEPAFHDCMAANKKKLSKACVDWADAHPEQTSGKAPDKDMAACIADAKRLCPGIPPMSDEFKACMMDHVEQLSPACRQARKDQAAQGPGSKDEAAPDAGPSKAEAACAKAIRKLCPKAAPDSEEYMSCMMENQAKLPKECRDADTEDNDDEE